MLLFLPYGESRSRHRVWADRDIVFNTSFADFGWTFLQKIDAACCSYSVVRKGGGVWDNKLSWSVWRNYRLTCTHWLAVLLTLRGFRFCFASHWEALWIAIMVNVANWNAIEFHWSTLNIYFGHGLMNNIFGFFFRLDYNFNSKRYKLIELTKKIEHTWEVSIILQKCSRPPT